LVLVWRRIVTMLDFEIEVEPAYFADLADADRCRDCRRAIAGRNTRCHQGRNESGYWVQCDDCNPLGPVPRGGIE